MWPLLPPKWSKTLGAIALVVLALAMATLAWWPMIDAYPKTPDLDGRYGFHQIEVAKAAIRQYGEMPLWNPFDCRGIPQWDHPEVITGSPVLLLATPLSGTVTVWVWNIFHAAVGFIAMWLLARKEFQLGVLSTFVAASMWAFSTAHTSQYAGAHASLEAFWFAPLLLLLWRRAETNVSAAVGLGITLAFMIYEGATYPTPYIVLVLALETLTRLRPIGRIVLITRAAAIVGVVAFGLAACRLLPLFAQFATHHRLNPYPDVDHLDRWFTIKSMFVWREGHWSQRLPGQQYVWGEYIAYVGYGGMFVAALGLLIALRRRPWLVVLGAIVFLLMLGHFASWSPWSIVQHHLFPYTSMRVPSRFRLVFHMFLCLWTALAIEHVPTVLGRMRIRYIGITEGSRAILLGVALLSAGDAMGLGKDIIEWMHPGAPEQRVERSPRFHYEGPGLAEFIDQPRQNRAWLGCRSYEWPSNSDAPLWVGDVPQAKALDPSLATLGSVVRTHNTFTIDVDAQAPVRILLNSAYARGWRTTVGQVVEHEKMLALDLPAGRYHVKLRYWPENFTAGIWISVLTTLGVLGYFARGLLRRLLSRLIDRRPRERA